MYQSFKAGSYADYEMERGTDQNGGNVEGNRKAAIIWRYEKQDTVACIYEGGLSVDDNKFLLFFGAILIIIGLAGLKF